MKKGVKRKHKIVSETDTSITIEVVFNPNKNSCQCFGDCDCSSEYKKKGLHKERITQFNTYQKYGKVKAKVSNTLNDVSGIEKEIQKRYEDFHTDKEKNNLDNILFYTSNQ